MAHLSCYRFTNLPPEIINIEVSEENKLDIYNYMHDNSYKLLDIKSLSHIFKRHNKK